MIMAMTFSHVSVNRSSLHYRDAYTLACSKQHTPAQWTHPRHPDGIFNTAPTTACHRIGVDRRTVSRGRKPPTAAAAAELGLTRRPRRSEPEQRGRRQRRPRGASDGGRRVNLATMRAEDRFDGPNLELKHAGGIVVGHTGRWTCMQARPAGCRRRSGG